ncbi:MAG: iron-sulfur cluster assembly scaffold protein, partial [Balneolales bacterium]|nr:iron-sulfur cluster assembly scaffold protein [Balneolales bacterium]
MKSYDDMLIRHAKQPVHAVGKAYRPFWEDAGSIEGDSAGAKVLFGRIEHRNRSCGDVVRLWWMSENGVLTHIRHHAAGCMLCKASASILCEVVEGRFLKELPSLIETATRLTHDTEAGDVGAPGEAATGHSGVTRRGKTENTEAGDVGAPGEAATGHSGVTGRGKTENTEAGDVGAPGAMNVGAPEAMLALSQVREFPTRRKCITLAWEA